MISAARCPMEFLPALAAFRNDTAVRIHRETERGWIRWPEDRDDVLAALRPIPGAEFFEFRPPHWYRAGSRLPSSLQPPAGHGEPLAKLLFPDRFPIHPADTADVPKLPLRLQRGGLAQSTSAMACTLGALREWGAMATTAELSSLRAAVSNSRVLLLGAKLPAIPGAERYWGHELFVPVGFQIVPELPTQLLRQAIGAGPDEVAFFGEGTIEIVPRPAFEPFTRAGLRWEVRT